MATVEAARPNSSTSVEFQTRDLSLTTALSFARRPPWIRQVKIWHLTIWSFEQSNTTSAAFTASMWVCCSGWGCCCCSEAAPDVEAVWWVEAATTFVHLFSDMITLLLIVCEYDLLIVIDCCKSKGNFVLEFKVEMIIVCYLKKEMRNQLSTYLINRWKFVVVHFSIIFSRFQKKILITNYELVETTPT